MKPEINTATAETVQTGGDQAVAQERLVRQSWLPIKTLDDNQDCLITDGETVSLVAACGYHGQPGFELFAIGIDELDGITASPSLDYWNATHWMPLPSLPNAHVDLPPRTSPQNKQDASGG